MPKRIDPELTAAFRKDPADEAFLERLNDALVPLESELCAGDRDEDLPTLFVVGLPRSGTTLLNQLVATCLDVGYVSNLAAAFWRAPICGMHLARKMLPDTGVSTFTSRFGRTDGPWEPHEFGYFWSERLGYRELAEPDDAQRDAIDWPTLRATLIHMSQACGRPMTFKPLVIGWHTDRLAEVMQRACFVHIRRDPVDVALSLLTMRRRFLGSEKEWASLRPAAAAALAGEPPATQVAGQVVHLELEFDRRLGTVHADRVLRIDYEELCRAPAAAIDAVHDLLARHGGPVERRGKPPAAFTASRRPGDDADEAARVETAMAALERLMLKTRWLAPSDPAWTEVLKRLPHDFYHLPGYAEMTARQLGAEPVAFCAETDDATLLLPLLVRPVPEESDAGGRTDALSPYGYPTPLLAAPDGERTTALATLLQAFTTAAVERGLVTVFLRLHPLFDLDVDVLGAAGTLVTHGPTVVIDLSKGEEQLARETREAHRRGARKLERAGFTTRVDDSEDHDAFIDAYTLTMQHVGATDDYYFDRAYFEDLRRVLGDHGHLLSVVAPDGRVAAAGLFPEVDGLVQHHLSGTHPDFRNQAPSKLLFWAVRRWAAERGARWFHLGGGVGGQQDSLFNFKAGFSRDRALFRSLRLVLDRAAYDDLNRLWSERHGVPDEVPGPAADAGFFPAYRAPAPKAPDAS